MQDDKYMKFYHQNDNKKNNEERAKIMNQLQLNSAVLNKLNKIKK